MKQSTQAIDRGKRESPPRPFGFMHREGNLKQPQVTIVTCHDEFLLQTLVDGCDGALTGFAGFVPELMVDIVHAALDADLPRAQRAQQVVAPLARIVYNFGEPGCDAHQRMKVARCLMGKFPSPHFRRPVRPLPSQDIQRIQDELDAIDYEVVR